MWRVIGSRMKIGVVLPTFRMAFADAREALLKTEEAGLDGAFVFDHLWPMRHREQPAIAAFPALGALSAHTSKATLGTLVARVGVVEPAVLAHEIMSVAAANDNLFIAGIGTGDRKGEEEFVAYGIDFASAAARRAQLEMVAQMLVAGGVPVWVGGGASETNELARTLGVTLNLWGVPPDRVRSESLDGPVSWAGNLPDDPHEASLLVEDLEASGATWSVFYWPRSMEVLSNARR